MNRKLVIYTMAALLMASCSTKDEIIDHAASAVERNAVESAKQPLAFGGYVDRTTTRAGQTGKLSNDVLKANGFGVIAYYTDNNLYSDIYKPNFMYNMQVKYDDQISAWTYEPVQFWPNEMGDSGGSESIDRLTFFAYAPWTEVTYSTGIVTGDKTSGIVGMTSNTATGDPYVKYIASLEPANQVDLTWGVANEAFTSSASSVANEIAAGDPYVDVVKPAVGSKIDFNFKHALAAFNVQVDADVDVRNTHQGTDNHTAGLDASTKIYVRKVIFEGFTTKGSFNLNASKPVWYDMSGKEFIETSPVSVYDGRVDGREGAAEAVNETPAKLNSEIVQQTMWNAAPANDGVTNVAKNLFASETVGGHVFVIPTGRPLRVTIVYDVETAEPNLPGLLSDGKTHGVSVENSISKNITLTNGENMVMEAGKLYTLKLHLGMTGVRFDVNYSNTWDSETANTDITTETSIQETDPDFTGNAGKAIEDV